MVLLWFLWYTHQLSVSPFPYATHISQLSVPSASLYYLQYFNCLSLPFHILLTIINCVYTSISIHYLHFSLVDASHFHYTTYSISTVCLSHFHILLTIINCVYTSISIHYLHFSLVDASHFHYTTYSISAVCISYIHMLLTVTVRLSTIPRDYLQLSTVRLSFPNNIY